LPELVAARGAQGLGFAAALIAAASYVAEIAPPRRLGQALGISGVLTLASQAVGPSVGELLEAQVGWSWVFRAAAIGGVMGAAIAAFLPRVDQHGGDREAGITRVWPALISTALAGFGFGAVWTFLADYAERVGVGGVTPFFIPYVIAAISTRIFLGHLSDVLGRRQVAIPALLGHAVALVALAQLAALWHLMAIGLVFGLAHGVYYPTLQAMIVEGSRGSRSRAIASSTFSFGGGIVVAAFSLGALAKHSGGYPSIYMVSAGAGVLAAAAVARRR
jgi:MFS family permease